MTELKPCPFCGGKAKMTKRQIRYFGMNYKGQKKIRMAVQVRCNRCKARGPVYTSTLIMPGSESYVNEWMQPNAARWWNDRMRDEVEHG